MNLKSLISWSAAIAAVGCNTKLVVDDTNSHLGSTAEAGSGGQSSAGSDAAPLTQTPPVNSPEEPGVATNAAACPATTPSGACTTEGLLCAYGDGGGDVCGCWAANNTELWWGCVGNRGTGSSSCPATEPSPGDSCYGWRGVECYYLSNNLCSCLSDAADPLWECSQYGARAGVPDRPTNIDGSKAISELSDTERQAWCQWYQELMVGPGYPAPPVGDVDANGYLQVASCGFGWDFFDHGLFPFVPADYCAQNLALSGCPLPVEQLSDCVQTWSTGMPAPTGCGRYIDTPECVGTIILSNTHDVTEGSGASLDPNYCLLRVQ